MWRWEPLNCGRVGGRGISCGGLYGLWERAGVNTRVFGVVLFVLLVVVVLKDWIPEGKTEGPKTARSRSRDKVAEMLKAEVVGFVMV